jgi:deoxyadenosine/deoxycytidine kinase
MHPYIVISGGIGAGKTTAAENLGAGLGVPVLLESPDRNPFLGDFYADNRRWALASCMWFLLRGLGLQAAGAASGAVQDHFPAEGVHVFGRALHARHALEERELDLLALQLEEPRARLRRPDLVISLQAPVDRLERRIRERNRAYERTIDRTYLEALEGFRGEFLDGWSDSPILRIDTTEVDFRTATGRRTLVSLARDALGA